MYLNDYPCRTDLTLPVWSCSVAGFGVDWTKLVEKTKFNACLAAYCMIVDLAQG